MNAYHNLAVNLVDFGKDFDLYDFRDQYDNDEDAIFELEKEVEDREKRHELRQILQQIVDEADRTDLEECSIANRAVSLVHRLNMLDL